jgi:ABC-type glucose/galactose transport system permease subunit
MRRNFSSLRLAIFVGVAGLLTIEGTALAQGKKKGGGDVEEMTFEDDKLLTSNLGPDQAKITTRGGPVRTILVRPRTSFVPEMLKSIESL